MIKGRTKKRVSKCYILQLYLFEWSTERNKPARMKGVYTYQGEVLGLFTEAMGQGPRSKEELDSLEKKGKRF